jgi:hypothetical protein
MMYSMAVKVFKALVPEAKIMNLLCAALKDGLLALPTII